MIWNGAFAIERKEKEKWNPIFAKPISGNNPFTVPVGKSQWETCKLVNIKEGLKLEKNIGKGGALVELEPNQDTSFPLIGYALDSGKSRWHVYHLEIYSKGLTAGLYRISTHFTLLTYKGEDFGPTNYPDYKLYANFIVGK